MVCQTFNIVSLKNVQILFINLPSAPVQLKDQLNKNNEKGKNCHNLRNDNHLKEKSTYRINMANQLLILFFLN